VISSYPCSAPLYFLLSWFSLAGCQVPTKAALSFPLLNWTGERKYDKRLMDRDKDRERSLSNYYHGKTDLSWGN